MAKHEYKQLCLRWWLNGETWNIKVYGLMQNGRKKKNCQQEFRKIKKKKKTLK